MKKTTLTITAILMSVLMVQAQSGYFVGGGIGFNSSNSEDPNGDKTEFSNFSFTPMVGKMLNNGLGVGVMLNYDNGTDKYTTINGNTTTIREDKSSSFGAGLFARKYFNISDIFKPVIQLDAGFSSGSSETTVTTNGTGVISKSDMSGIGVNIRPIIAVFMSPQFSMEFMFGGLMYNSTTSKPEGGEETTSSNLNFDVNQQSFGFGFVYYFGG